jgi:hypothetical protein
VKPRPNSSGLQRNGHHAALPSTVINHRLRLITASALRLIAGAPRLIAVYHPDTISLFLVNNARPPAPLSRIACEISMTTVKDTSANPG